MKSIYEFMFDKDVNIQVQRASILCQAVLCTRNAEGHETEFLDPMYGVYILHIYICTQLKRF